MIFLMNSSASLQAILLKLFRTSWDNLAKYRRYIGITVFYCENIAMQRLSSDVHGGAVYSNDSLRYNDCRTVPYGRHSSSAGRLPAALSSHSSELAIRDQDRQITQQEYATDHAAEPPKWQHFSSRATVPLRWYPKALHSTQQCRQRPGLPTSPTENNIATRSSAFLWTFQRVMLGSTSDTTYWVSVRLAVQVLFSDSARCKCKNSKYAVQRAAIKCSSKSIYINT